jgi:endonuclease YncB( thermonuclease family)
MRGTTDEIKALALQAQELTEKALKGASKIELRNPQRGKYFRIVSEVWIDEESLAMILKKQNLAKDYDGTGPRPEW